MLWINERLRAELVEQDIPRELAKKEERDSQLL
jgi:hypothetical protein